MSNAWSQSPEESICAFVVNNIASTLFQLDLRCGKAVFKFILLSFWKEFMPMNISHETGTVGFLNEQKSDLIWKKQQGT